MSEPHAYDMTRFQRIIGVDGGRVTGLFHVLSTHVGDYHVQPIDVTVWDSDDGDHTSGRVLYSGDLTAFVKDGVVDIPPHLVSSAKHDDVLGAMGAMESAVLAVTKAFAGSGSEPSEEGNTDA